MEKGNLTSLLRNQYAGQEAIVRTGHGTMDWFQIEKGVRQGCILSPCLFNLYAGYIIRHAQLDEAKDGIKISRRNINNLGYVDDTTLLLMAESEEELKILLMKVKEIQPVHRKENRCLIFTGRTDIEAETPILWPPDADS